MNLQRSTVLKCDHSIRLYLYRGEIISDGGKNDNRRRLFAGRMRFRPSLQRIWWFLLLAMYTIKLNLTFCVRIHEIMTPLLGTSVE